ncbi:MAG: DUF4874 domain-containing protein [Clostridiales bacterium]|jgi:hypothetical protein|nr:DUF4874 domain-containing protein [Clostridiales bacterium]
MKPKSKKPFFIAISILLIAASVAGAAYLIIHAPPRHVPPVLWDDDTEITESVATEFSYVDFSQSPSDMFLTADNAEPLLSNPDRGLRTEIYINLSLAGGKPEAYPGSGKDPYQYALDEFARYASDGPRLTQAYVYLSNYGEKKKIDAAAFDQMKRFFELCRDNDMRMLLRFAYATESPTVNDAKYDVVKAHLDQIGVWIKDNQKLFSDAVYAVQAGLVGYWGEGHTNSNFDGRYIGVAFEQLMNITPKRFYVQVRNTGLRSQIDRSYIRTGRVGAHDDYIVGDIAHMWSFFGSGFKPEYLPILKNTINDAEMPWGVALRDDSPTGEPLNDLNGFDVIKQLSDYSMTSFSLTHNYREIEGPPAPLSMERWKTRYLTTAELDAAGIVYNPNLFKITEQGDAPVMSAYDFLRYHLGYQLALSDVAVNDGKLTFSVTNFGMAAPLNFNAFTLVLEAEDGMRKEFRLAGYDKETFMPGKTVRVSVDIPAASAGSRLGLKLAIKGGSDIAARFANELTFQDGINFVAAI